MPTAWSAPYDVTIDKNGDVWTGSMLNDRVSRLDPKTGKFVEYLLPRETNIRRVFVDNSTTPGDVLGRQQPPGLDRQGRTAGLRSRAGDRRNAGPLCSSGAPADPGSRAIAKKERYRSHDGSIKTSAISSTAEFLGGNNAHMLVDHHRRGRGGTTFALSHAA